VTKLKEQANSDKQLVESMKMQIKELERTHSLEDSKSLEKVKELQARISTHSLENQTKDIEIGFLKDQLATLKKNREKDSTDHQVVVDNLNKRKVTEKNRLEEQLQTLSRVHKNTKESLNSEIQGIRNQLQGQVKALYVLKGVIFFDFIL
jgi:hypothetical protein